jgi:glycosyltransferase involved in cell wall biosynthesis
MNILFLAPNLGYPGGANRVVFKIADFLAGRNTYVEIWSDKVNLAAFPWLKCNVKIRQVSFGLSKLGRSSKILTFLLAGRCLNEPFDILFCHNFPSYFITLTTNKVPTIWHCNEPSIGLYPPPALIGPFTNKISMIEVKMGSTCFPLKFLDKLAVQRIRKIVAISEFVRRRIKEIYHRETIILREGIDLSRFNPTINRKRIREKYHLDDAPCVLVVSDFGKRIDIVFEAIRILSYKYDDIRLMLVGFGDLNALKRMVSWYRLNKHVIVVSQVPDAELPFYYAASDVFVFPQPYWSWSLATLEAMACGKPVIVPETCGIAEIITQNERGVKIKEWNSIELASQISRLLKDEAFRRQLGDAAWQYVRRYHDESRWLRSYYELLREVAES